MRELGSYFCSPSRPSAPTLSAPLSLPLALSLFLYLPLCLPLSLSLSPFAYFNVLFSLSIQCANNGSALLTQKVALWPQFPAPQLLPPRSLLRSLRCSPAARAVQHLDCFIAHSLQRRLVQSAPAKWKGACVAGAAGEVGLACLMNEIRNFVALLSLHCATHTHAHSKANGNGCGNNRDYFFRF